MNGEVFKSLTKLTTLDLVTNICIDENFREPMTSVATKVNLKCKFTEPKSKQTQTGQVEALQDSLMQDSLILKLEAELQESKTQIALLQKLNEEKTGNCQKEFKAEINNLKEVIENLNLQTSMNSDIKQLQITISELKYEKAELKFDVKAEKQQCQQHLNYIKELHQKLESQWEETLALKTNQLLINFEMKLNENSELLDELQQSKAEVIDNREQIKKLEKKIEILSGKSQW
jgi:DNA repair protein SbcC/Rad50